MQPQPYDLILQPKQATADINEIIVWYKNTIKNTLPPLMQSPYSETHPQQYDAF